MDWHIPVSSLALVQKPNKSTNICRGDKRLSSSVQLLGSLSALTERSCSEPGSQPTSRLSCTRVSGEKCQLIVDLQRSRDSRI